MNNRGLIMNSKVNSHKVITLLPDGTISYWHSDELEEALSKISTMDEKSKQKKLFVDGEKITKGRFCG